MEAASVQPAAKSMTDSSQETWSKLKTVLAWVVCRVLGIDPDVYSCEDFEGPVADSVSVSFRWIVQGR